MVELSETVENLQRIIGGLFANTITTRAQRVGRSEDPVELLNAAAYIDAYRHKVINKSTMFQVLREMGYDEGTAHIAYHHTKEFLTKEDNGIRRIANSMERVFDYYNANPTGTFPENRLNDIKRTYCKNMYRIGYDEDQAAAAFETLRPVPTFSILLEWLSKEVFEPEVRTRFKLDEDYPRIWDSLMQAMSVPEFERKAYWASHWNHPAPGQIGSMYTRFRSDRTNRSAEDAAGAGTTVDDLSMSKADFTEALKLHEIAPFWRDRIIANSFRPLPFSTLQQIWQYGTKDREWIKGRLEDYGYSSGNADILLNTWTRKYPPKWRAPFSINITKRYMRGVITRVKCIADLRAEGLDANTAEYVTGLIDDKRTLEIEKEVLRTLKRRYARVKLSMQEIENLAFAKLNDRARSKRIAEIVVAGENGAFSRMRIRDITRALADGKIDNAGARAALDNLRTLDSDVDILLALYAETSESS